MRTSRLCLAMLALTAIGCHTKASQGPVVVITATCRGADVETVADTVAAPIEQQVNGVESMEWMESESHHDGRYVARVWFRRGTDPDLVAVLVQNRVALAAAVLPDEVRRTGVTVTVQPAAPEGEDRVVLAVEDRGNLGQDALRQCAEAIAERLTAAAALQAPEVFPGPNEKRVHVQLDRAKCAARGVSVAEVTKAVQAAGADATIEALQAAQVHSEQGAALPLGAVATLELADAPAAVYRANMYRAVRIAGAPPAGTSAAAAEARCAKLAEEGRTNQRHAGGLVVEPLAPR